MYVWQHYESRITQINGSAVGRSPRWFGGLDGTQTWWKPRSSPNCWWHANNLLLHMDNTGKTVTRGSHHGWAIIWGRNWKCIEQFYGLINTNSSSSLLQDILEITHQKTAHVVNTPCEYNTKLWSVYGSLNTVGDSKYIHSQRQGCLEGHLFFNPIKFNPIPWKITASGEIWTHTQKCYHPHTHH